MPVLYLFLAITLNVSSYVLYKSVAQKQHTLIWYLFISLGLTLGAMNVLFFTKSLKQIPLNVAYPVFSGTCILAIAVISTLVFGERLSANNLVGATLVIIGIAFLTA